MDARVSPNSSLVFETHGCILIKTNFYLIVINFALVNQMYIFHIYFQCTVQALKLVQLAVEHFLSPNMALLVDNLQGSALVCLGPIIVKRMHDTMWEVRDTTLELTTSIANISRISKHVIIIRH